MGAEDVFPAEMPDDPSAPIDLLDDDTAERLLSGRLDPLDAPPPYATVARLLRAAAAPPTPDELAGGPAALAAFRSRQARPLSGAGVRPRLGAGVRSRRRLVAVALAGTLAAGGLWTAQGAALLPGLPSRSGAPEAGGWGSGASRSGGTGSGGSGSGGLGAQRVRVQGVGPGALRVAGLETAAVPGRRPSAVPAGRDRVAGARGGEPAAPGGGPAHGAKPDRPGKPAKPKPPTPKPPDAKPDKAKADKGATRN
jgi:hypothetical protein